MPARRYRPTPANLARLGAALRRGELVAVPSETVYGLAGDALNAAAVAAIFAAKGRPAHDPLIVHLARAADVATVAVPHPAVAALARAFWPGPLTLVLPKLPVVPDAVTSGRPTVAVRVPAHPAFRALLRAAGRPLAAPSANPFGYVSPTTADHVADGLGERIPHILDGGPCRIGVESTVLDLRDPRRPILLRPGAVSAADIEAVLGVRVRRLPKAGATKKGPGMAPPATAAGAGARGSVAANATKATRAAAKGGTADAVGVTADAGGAKAAKGDATPKAPAAATPAGELSPGLLDRHYSPATPLTLHRRVTAALIARSAADEAWLLRARPADAAVRGRANVFWLDARGSAEGAARRLFDRLRALDGGRWRQLHAELFPGGSGLAEAINDRLTRAAARG